MKCSLYCCLIFILGHHLDAFVVKLQGISDEEKRSASSTSEHDLPIDFSLSDAEGFSQEKSSDFDSYKNNNAKESKVRDEGETNVSGDGGKDKPADETEGGDKPADGTDVGEDNPGDGTDAGEDKPADGTDVGEDKPGDGTDAGEDIPADGTDVGEDKPGDGTDVGEDKPADGTDVGEDQPADTIEVPEDIKEMDDENDTEKYNGTKTLDLWKSEVMAGNFANNIYASNPHIFQPDEYPHLNRRFVPQYPYTYVEQNNEAATNRQKIIPIEASPEIVESVAMKSALLEASKPNNDNNQLTPNMLRSGDYWNGVWKEDVYPKSGLRKPEQKSLGTIKARIMPGSEFHNVVAELKKISPKLLYIINVNK